MPKARDEAGNIWETDAQGKPVRLLQPAGPSSVTIGKPNPVKQETDQAELARIYASIRDMGADNARADAAAGRDATKDQKEFADAELKKTRKAFTDNLKADNIFQVIQEARAIVRKGGNTGYGSFLAYLPETDARALKTKLDTIRANLTFDQLQNIRDNSPTGGAVGNASDNDMRLLGSTVASLDQGLSSQDLLDSLGKIETHYTRFQAFNNGFDPNKADDQKELQGYLPQDRGAAPGAGNDDPGTPAMGIDERYATDNDKKFAAVIQSAFDQGASPAELDQLANKYGYPKISANPQAAGQLAEAIAYRDGTGKYEKFGPQRGARMSAPESGYNDPGIARRAMQNVASGPLGAYFGQAANAMSMGTLDEILGLARGDTLGDAFSGTGQNTAEANLKKSLTADANPGSATFGNITGGALTALGTEGLIAGKALSTLAPRAILADALYGGAYGAGESNDNRLSGVLLGGLAGAGGGVAGRGAMRQLGNIAGGLGGPGAYLYREGVQQTPGQMGASSGGTLGGILKGREDRLSGYSGIGDLISKRQREGLEQFNRAGFRQGVEEPLGALVPGIAEEGIQNAEDAVRQGYTNALSGQSFTPDRQFIDGMGANVAAARQLPAIGDQVEYSLQRSIEPFIDPNTNLVDGRGMQQMLQELRRRASRFDKSQDAVGPDAANILRNANQTVQGMVERQAPDVMPALNNANKANRNYRILEDAVGRARNNEGVFTASQLGDAAIANARKFGGDIANTDRPFFELQRAGQQILPKKVPDSGTAGRVAAGDGISGLLKSVARNARAPIYARPTINLLNELAYNRPQAAVDLGELLRKYAYLGGVAGAPLALQQQN